MLYYLFWTCNPDDGWCIGIAEKSFSNREFNYVGGPKGSFRDRQLHPSHDDNASFFSNALPARPFLREPFSHNSNYPRRPARARSRSSPRQRGAH